MRFSLVSASLLMLFFLSLSACEKLEENRHEEHRTILVSSPAVKDVTVTEEYVCQIHSRRHIEVCSLASGYLEEVLVKEGQTVKQGDSMFKILPALYQAKFETEVAEAKLAEIEFENTKKLFDNRVVSDRELALSQAKLTKALAQVQLSRAELGFTDVKAPFDGIIDRLHHQQGSLIEEGAMLTSLSDNSVMWVYFNVPEARYLEYMTDGNKAQDDVDHDQDDDNDDDDDDQDDEDDEDGDADDDDDEVDDNEDVVQSGSPTRFGDLQVELLLANGTKFKEAGSIGAIEGEFNSETGNIAFRADFPNPDRLLRHGQTGTILIRRVLNKAVVIPQRATFEILDKSYVFLIGDDNVAHQKEIEIEQELEDVYVIRSGVKEGDNFVLEGARNIRDGEKVESGESEFRPPDVAMKDLKNEAE